MPAYGEGWTALDLCGWYRCSYTEHYANSDIHPHQPIHLYKILLKSGKISIHREPHGRDWEGCWLEIFWVHVGEEVSQALLWGGDALLCTHTSPSGPLSQPHSGNQSLPHQRQCSTSHPWSPSLAPEGSGDPKSNMGEGLRKAKGTELKHEASTGLDPTSSWNFYQLNTAGTRSGGYTCSFLDLSCLSLFLFLLLTPSSQSFE